nr:hypothetical protein [Streptomyces albireticuli]
MSADLATAGQELQYAGTGMLWLAVALRAGPSLRSPERRGLWLAVATAAVAMTLNLPEAARLAQRVTGSAHTTALVRNLCGVLSAGAVLYFVTATTGSRRLRNRLSLATGGVLAVLVVLDLAAPPHQEHTIPHSGAPVPSTAYWLVMIASHLAANISCAHLCWRYGRQADSRSLKVSLSTFGTGTAFAGLFWTGHLAHLLTGTEAPSPTSRSSWPSTPSSAPPLSSPPPWPPPVKPLPTSRRSGVFILFGATSSKPLPMSPSPRPAPASSKSSIPRSPTTSSPTERSSRPTTPSWPSTPTPHPVHRA